VKAWNITAVGEPADVMELVERPVPRPAPRTIRVEVEAVGLNYLDAMVSRGVYPAGQKPPVVPGAEFAGRVAEVGEGSEWSVGARVAAMNPLAFGCLAESAVVPDYAAFAIPDDVTATVAAALVITYQTAYFALHHRARLQPGEFVLVHAGAGGVGTAAIQLAAAAGARPLATARGASKTAVCLEEGAELAVDYQKEDFVAAVRDYTDGHGADVICDQIGGDVFTNSLDCLAFEGRILPIGYASGVPPTIDVSALARRNQAVFGLGWGGSYPRERTDLVREAHAQIIGLYRSGQVRPRISNVAAFADAPAALQQLGEGKTIGKIVIALT
jgi:NADPH2:quinone reductase